MPEEVSQVVQAESTPVAEPVVTTEVTETKVAEQTTEIPEEVEGKPESRAEKRIKQLVAKQREAERDAEYWRGVAQGQQKPQPQPIQQAAPAPKPEDFESYDDYLVSKAKHEYRAETQAAEQKRTLENLERNFEERISKAAETDPEILEIRNDRSLPISTAMAWTIKESEAAPEILKYLSNNRNESAKIAQMNPIAAAREIGKIEQKMLSQPKPETKKVSQAPEPIKPVIATGAQTVDIEKIPMDEFFKRRNQEQFGTRR